MWLSSGSTKKLKILASLSRASLFLLPHCEYRLGVQFGKIEEFEKMSSSRNDVGKMKRRVRMQYFDNIKKWTRASLEENVRLTQDRTAWMKISGAA